MAVFPYERKANFVSFETANPTAPKRGTDMDAEFDAVAAFSAAISLSLSLIQRDDGLLRNLSVHPDALSEAVRMLVLLQGADIRGAWATGTDYVLGDVVSAPNGSVALCYAPHTAGLDFAVDQPSHWLVIAAAASVQPRTWEFVGDGATKEFLIPGADVAVDSMYQVVVGGVTQAPDSQFDIVIAPDTSGSKLVLSTAPGDGVTGFVVLNGYPQPAPIDFVTQLMNNQSFLDFLNNAITNNIYETTNVLKLGPLKFLLPLADLPDSATIDGSKESYLLRSTSGADVTFTIRANTGDAALDWETNPIAAPFFSVLQAGAGQVSILPENAGVTIRVPEGFLAKTRGANSIITATCDYASGGTWVLSGDLARDTASETNGAVPCVVLASAAGVVPLDVSLGTYFALALSEDVTGWTVTNPPPAGYAKRVFVSITQNAASAKTVAWPAAWKWIGAKPSVPVTLGATCRLTLTTFDGTTWQAELTGAFA